MSTILAAIHPHNFSAALDVVAQPPVKESLDKLSSDVMMDVSSNGSSVENMETLMLDSESYVSDSGEYPTLVSGVFGVSKCSSDFPESIDLNCNILGEDAYFICDHAVGIFDGVGGWKSNGVDPSEYSSALASACQMAAAPSPKQRNYEPKEILTDAYRQVEQDEKVIGSSTACILCLQPHEDSGDRFYLHSSFIGDSGFIIIRKEKDVNGKPGRCVQVFKSTEQQHYFNAPYQLALVHGRFAHLRNTIFNDKPHEAECNVHEVRQGDVIIVGSDGLLDNLFDYEITQIVNNMYDSHPQDIAREIARRTYYRSLSTETTPFEVGAKNNGQYFRGGKRDDISVIVAKVSLPEADD